LDLVQYLNEKGVINEEIKPSYDFATIERICFCFIDLILEIKYTYLKKDIGLAGAVEIRDVYDQFINLKLGSINDNERKFKRSTWASTWVRQASQLHKIKNACMEDILFDHMDTAA
jgi:hypothetical protein